MCPVPPTGGPRNTTAVVPSERTEPVATAGPVPEKIERVGRAREAREVGRDPVVRVARSEPRGVEIELEEVLAVEVEVQDGAHAVGANVRDGSVSAGRPLRPALAVS